LFERARVRIVPWVAAAIALTGCATVDRTRPERIAVGVAAAEFRVRERRWPTTQAELAKSACRAGGPLAALADETTFAPRAAGARSCADRLSNTQMAIAFEPSADTLVLRVQDLSTNRRCVLKVRYAGDERAKRTGLAAIVSTTLFRCR
jgi:hypothetical protein